MEECTNQQKIIDLGKVVRVLNSKKTTYFKVLPLVFVLSCLWILPQPRFYDCTVELAPESSDAAGINGIASLASSFGINIGGANGGADAIYPTLYPDLFESPDFLVELLNIRIQTLDSTLQTDYYTYLAKYQKKNWLTQPFSKAIVWLKRQLSNERVKPSSSPADINSFRMSYFDYMIVEKVKSSIKCNVDKKTDVITISVQDQDPLVCATLADSVMLKLQNFIIKYRTSKARQDVEYYTKLTEEAEQEYNSAIQAYSAFCDSHTDVILQSSNSERDKLENELASRLQTYTSLRTQLQIMCAKVQERTPAFTTLKSATVPVKPAGPKRMIFVAGMLMLAFIATSLWISRAIILK